MLDLIVDAVAIAVGGSAAAGTDPSRAVDMLEEAAGWLDLVATSSPAAWTDIDASEVNRWLRAAGLSADGLLGSASGAVRDSAAALASATEMAKQMVERLGLSDSVSSVASALLSAVTSDQLGGGISRMGAGGFGASAHLLIATTMDGSAFYFSLNTASFEKLHRSTNYGVAKQERLTRDSAAQGVSRGGETISISGVIFPEWRGGIRQVDQLRDIGAALKPVQLTTGYGDVLGRWMVSKIDEEQSTFIPNGGFRRQSWTMEFERYGDDFKNV